jgi:hypothetical protein
LIIQHVYADSDHARLLEFCEPYHTEYAVAHQMDYRALYGPEHYNGGGDWLTLRLTLQALEDGYKYVIKLDADALIVRNDVDLREACKGVGACFDRLNVQQHYNTGVMYFENTPEVIDFLKLWLSLAPGTAWNGYQWGEQGELNKLAADHPVVQTLANKWNCYAGTPCYEENEAVVIAYHGPNTIDYKLADMKRIKGV